jgi:hypothetical protein
MKYIAPLVVVVLVSTVVLLYAFGFFSVADYYPSAAWIKVLIVLGVGGFLAAIIAVYIQRVKEIKEEDKDDLSKY